MAEPFKHIYNVDLNQPLKRFDIGDILATGDEKANSFEVTVCRDGANVDLTGCTVYGYFIRPNEETMLVDGTANGSMASVALSKSCYVYDGAFSFAIKITGNGITQTVAAFDGRIVKTTTETIVDGDRVIYTTEDLLAQIAATEAAADRANSAAERAEQLNIDASGLAGDSNKLGGKTPEYYLQPRNLLDNSDFRNPVNQRGLSVYEGVQGYNIDRWLQTNTRCTLTQGDGYISINSKDSAQYFFSQYIPAQSINAGKTHTFAICDASGEIALVSAVYSTSMETATVYKTFATSGAKVSLRMSYSESKDCYRVMIEGSHTEELQLTWAALYEGEYTADTLPAYQPKGYAAELAECQRYYIRYEAAENAMFLPGGSNHNTVYATLHLPIPMRIDAPTIAWENVNLYAYTADSAVVINAMTVHGDEATHGYVTLRMAHDTDAILAGCPACVRILSGGYIALSADL